MINYMYIFYYWVDSVSVGTTKHDYSETNYYNIVFFFYNVN